MESIVEIVRLLVNLSNLWAKKKGAFLLKTFSYHKIVMPMGGFPTSLAGINCRIGGFQTSLLLPPTWFGWLLTGDLIRTPSRGWITL
jgi:hypothetical protein